MLSPHISTPPHASNANSMPHTRRSGGLTVAALTSFCCCFRDFRRSDVAIFDNHVHSPAGIAGTTLVGRKGADAPCNKPRNKCGALKTSVRTGSQTIDAISIALGGDLFGRIGVRSFVEAGPTLLGVARTTSGDVNTWRAVEDRFG